MTRVTIIGGGKYGSAIGCTVQEDSSRNLTFLVRKPSVVEEVNAHRYNSQVSKDLIWKSNVTFTTSAAEALQNCDIAFLCIPAQEIPGKLSEIRKMIEPKTLIVSCAKGMILAKRKFLSQEIKDEYPELYDRYHFQSGPSFASEVFKKWPTQCVIAGPKKESCVKIMDAVWSPFFKTYWQDDVIGCELAAACKNVQALGAGYIEGLGYGYNTMACWVTRGVKEVQMLAKHFGAKPTTLIGLAGAGDIMLSCFGSLSRNRTCGERLAKGEKLDDIVLDIGTVEGVPTMKVLYDVMQENGIRTTGIIQGIYKVFYEGLKLDDALQFAMKNNPHHEYEGLNMIE